MLYLKGRNQKLTSSEAQCSGHRVESAVDWSAVCCHEFWGRRTERSKSLLGDSQCYSSRPNVHFKPWKGVQSVGNFWRLEGRRALTGATCVVFCKWMKGLKECGDKTMRDWTCDVIQFKICKLGVKVELQWRIKSQTQTLGTVMQQCLGTTDNFHCFSL